MLALSVAVQASLIAFGAFALEDNIDNGPVSDGDTTGVTLHWLPIWARRRASAATFLAWVSVIHALTTAGSAPASRVAR